MSSCFRNFLQSIQESKNLDEAVESLVCAWDAQVDLVNCLSDTLGISQAQALYMVQETVLAIKSIKPDAAILSGGASVIALPPRAPRPTPTPTPTPTPQPVPGPGPGTPGPV